MWFAWASRGSYGSIGLLTGFRCKGFTICGFGGFGVEG